MTDWLTDTLLVPMAEELAQELGIQIPFGTAGKLAGTFLTTEALRASLDVLIPLAESGISFSTTGLTLALIQHKLREINKKLDLLLDCNRKTAKDKLSEALNALEYGNFLDAFEEFKKASDKATEAYHTCQDNESRITCARIKLFSLMMMKSYDAERNVFIPFSRLSIPRKKELASLLRVTLDSLLLDVEVEKFDLTDTLMLRTKSKKKLQQSKMNETFCSSYPLLSEGLQWTQPMEPIQEISDVQIIKIFPQYLPIGESNDLKLVVGRRSTGEPIHISVYRETSSKYGNKLFVENVSFPIDDSFDNSIMLEFFAGKMMPFRNDTSLFLCAARSGRSQILLSVLDRHEDFDVNEKNFKGEFALGLAVRHRHSYVVELLTEMPNIDPRLQDAKGNTALHEAGICGDCQILNFLFSVLVMNDINTGNGEGETPLFLAAANGHYAATELLLDNGSQVNISRRDGLTPLMIASANGHHSIVDLLLKFQADKLASRKQDGATALHLASSRGHVEVVKTLTKRMSRVEIRTVRLSEAGLNTQSAEVAAILKKSGAT